MSSRETPDSMQPRGAPIELADKVAALSSPCAYPYSVATVERIETHFAWVFLTAHRAYKLKKPVRVGEMDLSSIAMRAIDCNEELRLNRRLAADVYLGVVPLVATQGRELRIGGPGTIVDWLIEMHRLPAAKMLDRAIAAGTVSTDVLRSLGGVLAQFYEAQQRVTFEPEQYVQRLKLQIDADRQALCDPRLFLDGSRVELLASEQTLALDTLVSQLGGRAASGRIVEAHGDLRPEHVCLRELPCVIDSLEFSLDLRTLDALEELAFLCVECEQAGAEWVGRSVLDAYRIAAQDEFTSAVFDFYRSRRATVRAKVLAWHLLDPAVRDAAAWTARANVYLLHARRDARRAIGAPAEPRADCG